MVDLKSLEKYKIVASYEVDKYQHWSGGFFYTLTVRFSDGSILHAREYVSETERMYSFHLQNSHGRLLKRWDNAPNHRDIPTHPHHVHSGTEISESRVMDLDSVLLAISAVMEKG